MRSILPLTLLLVWGYLTRAQETSAFLRDSIYCDRGVPNSTDFEPETRIYFTQRDDRGRVIEQEFRQRGNDGIWRPFRRHLSAYEGDYLSQLYIQLWNPNTESWRDQRKDLYTYEDELLKEFIRQKAPQGTLVNDRRWLYNYNEEGRETGVLLQQWNGMGWMDISRKVVEYNENGQINRQTLQVWIVNDWQNIRRRDWNYHPVNGNVLSTVVKVWSQAKQSWVDQLQKLFFYNDDGLWVRSRFEDWNEELQQWEPSSRMQYLYNGQRQPIGQFLQVWDGDWENRGQVNYTFLDNQFISRIETWDETTQDWANFLRYRVEYDDRGLLKTRTGMQAWDDGRSAWENRSFTQRYTHFWSEAIVNDVDEATQSTACVIPNPYPVGTFFFCDLPPSKNNFQLELYDMLGRTVYRKDLESGQAVSIDRRPAPGVYVLRIHDQQQLYHLQRLVIH